MQVDSYVQTPTAKGAAHKALSVLMALVLALGLTPLSKQRAYAEEGSYTLTIVKENAQSDSTLTLRANGAPLTISDNKVTITSGTSVVIKARVHSDDEDLLLSKNCSVAWSGGSVAVSDEFDYESYDTCPTFTMPEGDATLTISYPNGTDEPEPSATHALKTDVGEGGYGIWFTVGKNYEATEAEAGTDVGVEVGADKGYEVDKVTMNGTDITDTLKGGLYWFTMPDEDVTVAATFKATSTGGEDGDTWGFYNDTVNMTDPATASSTVQFDAKGTFSPVVSGVYLTKNGSTTNDNPGGTVTYQVFGSLDDGAEQTLSNAVTCGWNSLGSKFFVPGSGEYESLTVSAPEQAGDWKMYVKASLAIDGKTVATGKSVTWTMTVSDQQDDTFDVVDQTKSAGVSAVHFRIGEDNQSAEGTKAAKDQNVYVNAIINSGYKFVKIVVTKQSDAEGTNPLTVYPAESITGHPYFKMPDEPVNVVVVAEKPSYNVVFDEYMENGSIAVSESSADSVPFTYEDVEDAAYDGEDFKIGLTVSAGEGYEIDLDSLRVVGDDDWDIDGVSIEEDEYGDDDLIIVIDYLRFDYDGENLKVMAEFKKPQTITVDSSFTKKYGDEEFNLGATVDSGAALSYKSSDDGVVTVGDDGKVTIVAPGTATITVTAAGTDELFAAEKTVNITVGEGDNALPAASALAAEIAPVPYSEAATQVTAFKADEIAKATGDVVYVKKSGSKALSVNASTGVVTLASSTAPGLYTANIIVLAAGDENHAAKYEIVPVSVTVTKASIEGKAVTLSKGSFTYNGKAQAPAVKKVGGFTFSAGDFDVTYSNAASTNAGNYTVTVAAKADSLFFSGTAKVATYKINKAANPFATKNVSKTFTLANVKKGKGTIAFADYRKSASTAAQGKMTNKVGKQVNAKTKKAVKYFSVDANGKVTAAKNTPKGTYQVTLSMKAAGNANYNASKELKPVLTVTVK